MKKIIIFTTITFVSVINFVNAQHFQQKIPSQYSFSHSGTVSNQSSPNERILNGKTIILIDAPVIRTPAMEGEIIKVCAVKTNDSIVFTCLFLDSGSGNLIEKKINKFWFEKIFSNQKSKEHSWFEVSENGDWNIFQYVYEYEYKSEPHPQN